MNPVAIRTLKISFVSACALQLTAPGIVDGDTAGKKAVLTPWTADLAVGVNMESQRRSLRGCELVGTDLEGARFDASDLNGARIFQCNLSGASFVGAKLEGLDINDCSVVGADFSDAIINGAGKVPPDSSRFTNIILSEHQLKSTHSYKTSNLRDCVIRGGWWKGVKSTDVVPTYNFSNAILEGALLADGDFTRSTFTGAAIHETIFDSCALAFSQLKETRTVQVKRRLGRSKFINVTFLDQIDFSGLDLSGCHLNPGWTDAIFDDASIEDCFVGKMVPSQIISTRSFKNGRLLRITFVRANLSGVDFGGQNMTGCEFIKCNFKGASLDGTVITDASFTRPENLSGAQIAKTWNYKHGRMDRIQLPANVADALTNGEANTVAGTLSGRVILNRRPLGGTIRIVGSQNNPVQLTTDTRNDGRYEFAAQNLALGRCKVMITSDQVSIPKRYNESSQLSVEIQAGDNRADFELTLRSH